MIDGHLASYISLDVMIGCQLTHIETYVENRSNRSSRFDAKVPRRKTDQIGDISVSDIDSFRSSSGSYVNQY